jgi:hypothetical protein
VRLKKKYLACADLTIGDRNRLSVNQICSNVKGGDRAKGSLGKIQVET